VGAAAWVIGKEPAKASPKRLKRPSGAAYTFTTTLPLPRRLDPPNDDEREYE